MPTTLTVLHLSDLHYDAAKPTDTQIVLDALCQDLRTERMDGTIFDIAIFSGDLVQAGGNQANFDTVSSHFVEPLLQAANISHERFFLAPGNHDINASEVVPFIDSGLRTTLGSVPEINEFIDTAIRSPSIATNAALSRMKPFDSFLNSLNIGPYVNSNAFFRTRLVVINGLTVGVAALNSAWRATGKSGDKSHLIVGERVLDLAVKDIAAADIKICILHHPFDWLLDADEAVVQSRVFSSFDLVCHGHIHRAVPAYMQSTLGSAVVSQCGTLYASRRYPNGYQIIRWDELARSVSFKCRTYYDTPRREFAPAENISPGGHFEIQLAPRASRVNLTEFEIFMRQARPTVRARADEHISLTRGRDSGRRDDITETFVCPPLSRHTGMATKIVSSAGGDEQADEETSPETILRMPHDIILAGDGETGRTSLLYYLSVRLAEGVSDQPRVPAVVNMPLLTQAGSYDRAIQSYYSEIDLPPSSIRKAIKTMPFLAFIDDLDANDKKHLQILSQVRQQYPNHRIIATTRTASAKAGSKALNDSAVINIGYLSRKNIRQLSRVRFPTTSDAIDDPGYQIVMKYINAARLPRTGYMVTLLLWAAEQNRIKENLNEAVLLENLISFLLGKTNFESALRDQFDPRAQEFLLRTIAVYLRSCDGWVESNKLMEFVIKYFTERGLKYGARQVIDEFISCKLLVETDGHISFKYRCFQEYFVALEFLRNPDALGSMYDAPTDLVLGYAREIDLWSSLSREFHRIDEALLFILHEAGLDVDNQALTDTGQLQFIGGGLKLSPGRVHDILDDKLTKDQVDELLDEAERFAIPAPGSMTGRPPAESEHSTSSARPGEDTSQPDTGDATEGSTIDEEAALLVTQRRAITLLARVVRNCDHEKVENKRRALNAVLRLWSAHIYNVLDRLLTLIQTKSPEIIGKGDLDETDIATIQNLLRVSFSSADGTIVGGILSVNFLRPMLHEIVETRELPEGMRFLAANALAEAWDDDAIKFMKGYFGEMRNVLLKHSLLSRMLQDYRFQRCKMGSIDKFRNLIAESEIVLGSPRLLKGQRIQALIDEAKKVQTVGNGGH